MSKTKKLTVKYWKSLSHDSRERALKYVFPLWPSAVEMLLNDPKPSLKDHWWKLVFEKVRVPIPNEYEKRQGYTHYKTIVNHTYIP